MDDVQVSVALMGRDGQQYGRGFAPLAVLAAIHVGDMAEFPAFMRKGPKFVIVSKAVSVSPMSAGSSFAFVVDPV